MKKTFVFPTKQQHVLCGNLQNNHFLFICLDISFILTVQLLRMSILVCEGQNSAPALTPQNFSCNENGEMKEDNFPLICCVTVRESVPSVICNLIFKVEV